MKQTIITLLLSILCLKNGYAQSWLPVQTPETTYLAKSIDSPTSTLAALGAHLFMQSPDQGKTWLSASNVMGASERMIDFEMMTNPQTRWFLLTSRGLNMSNDDGKTWQHIFEPDGSSKSVWCLAQNPFQTNILYLGTSNGVFKSNDYGLSWNRSFGELTNQAIHQIVIDAAGQNIYFTSTRSLYRYHLGHDTFREVFSKSVSVNELIESVDSDDYQDLENERNIPKIYVALAPREEHGLFVADGETVFTSNDEGESWSKLPSFGLNASSIRGLTYLESSRSILVSSETKIFRFNYADKTWSEIYEGLAVRHIYHLSAQEKPTPRILASTDQGLFTYEMSPELVRSSQVILSPERMDTLKELFNLEPSIAQIQKTAIDYANVNNGKIKRWHTQSRLRSLIPSITFSKDLDIGNNIHVDTGSTTSPDVFVQGPDDRSKSTDLNLSWNLADMIWSSSQTSIDSREKLMIELRDQILSEVTRIYFERKRMILSLASNPTQTENERINHLIRIQELTANLDALTGGYFTRELEKLAASHFSIKRFYNLFEAE